MKSTLHYRATEPNAEVKAFMRNVRAKIERCRGEIDEQDDQRLRWHLSFWRSGGLSDISAFRDGDVCCTLVGDKVTIECGARYRRGPFFLPIIAPVVAGAGVGSFWIAFLSLVLALSVVAGIALVARSGYIALFHPAAFATGLVRRADDVQTHRSFRLSH